MTVVEQILGDTDFRLFIYISLLNKTKKHGEEKLRKLFL